jgi:hypothetical protein
MLPPVYVPAGAPGQSFALPVLGRLTATLAYAAQHYGADDDLTHWKVRHLRAPLVLSDCMGVFVQATLGRHLLPTP